MISLAKAADCDAIHPGFGFLSEKASFAKKIEESGLIWVGPSYKSIEQMASKAEAKLQPALEFLWSLAWKTSLKANKSSNLVSLVDTLFLSKPL